MLKALLDLQNVDAHLNGVRTRLAGFPKALAAADARAAAARAEVDRCKAAQLENVKARKKFELDVEQWKEKARKYKDQSFQVKTNDAFKALQHEVQMAEDEVAKAEDRLLEQMVSSEEYDRRIKAAEKSLKDAEESTRKERGEIQSEQASAQKDLGELEAERARLLEAIPEDLVDHYQRIARKHNGIALAEVRESTCSACGVRIRPHVLQELHRGGDEDIFHCETCTRIIYYIEPPSQAQVATPPTGEQASALSSEG